MKTIRVRPPRAPDTGPIIECKMCNHCATSWPSYDDSLAIHVLIAHPETEEAEALLLQKKQIHVPRWGFL